MAKAINRDELLKRVFGDNPPNFDIPAKTGQFRPNGGKRRKGGPIANKLSFWHEMDNKAHNVPTHLNVRIADNMALWDIACHKVQKV